MNITVTGRVVSKDVFDHGVDHGRFWDVPTYYLYTMAWDPFILSRLDAAPVLREPADTIAEPGDTILLFAHPNDEEDAAVVRHLLDVGGKVVLNHPSRQLIDQTGERFCCNGFGQTIISLRERWLLEAVSSRQYIYPHMQPFLRLNPDGGRVLSHIGGNPDLIVGRQVAVFAGDPIAAAYAYQHMPGRLSELIADLAGLLGQVVACFTDNPVSRGEQRLRSRKFEMRRDFHAFGFAWMTVRELDRCYGGANVDLRQAADLAIDAARRLVQGMGRDAAALLRRAFEALERENRKVQPLSAVFTDTLHGGELYPDIGYFEIDWPEHPAAVLRTYLEWVKTRSYRFNVDLGATTVRELANRFPDLFAQLTSRRTRSRIEFVNGSCNQPYPPFHSLESQIRQFDVGRQVWRDVLDATPKTYASQEFGFCPQLAAVLKQQGYKNAVVRVQNMGDAPTSREQQINWEAPNGDRLRSLPSHPHKSEQRNEFTYNNLHLKLYLHQQDKLDFAVFTCLGDITFHRPMREELARVCHYAPVFGRFDTFQGYFRRTRKASAPVTRFYMREFKCDAAFINLELWSIYKNYTGNYNSNCINSMASTNLFAAAELVDAVTAARGVRSYQSADHEQNWEALTHYQGHGTYIVPYFQSGGFLGTGDNPRSHEQGRALQEVAEYLGPIDFRPVKQVTDHLMAEAQTRANNLIRDRLAALASGGAGAPGFCLYNFAPTREQVVRLPDAAGKAFALGDHPLWAQDDGADRLVQVSLPAYGWATIHESQESAPPLVDAVTVGPDFLENGIIRVEFDLRHATLRRLVRQSDGQELLAANSHAFYFPGSSPQVCRGSRVLRNGPLRGCIEFDIELRDEHGEIFQLNTRASLDAGQPVVAIETDIVQAPAVEGNQWVNHLGVRFELADEAAEIFASHFNTMESFPHRHIFSPNLLLARGPAVDVVCLNEGNQFYVRDGKALSQILIMENEPARRFHYAVGCATVNPIMQARAWSQPCFIVPVHTDETLGVDYSLVHIDSEDVELLSCRYDDGALLLRLANTCGAKVGTTVGAFAPIASASITSLAGDHQSKLRVQNGRAKLNLRPWDIQQLRVTLDLVTPL